MRLSSGRKSLVSVGRRSWVHGCSEDKLSGINGMRPSVICLRASHFIKQQRHSLAPTIPTKLKYLQPLLVCLHCTLSASN